MTMKKTYITPKNNIIEIEKEVLLNESNSSKISVNGFDDLGWGGVYDLNDGGD